MSGAAEGKTSRKGRRPCHYLTLLYCLDVLVPYVVGYAYVGGRAKGVEFLVLRARSNEMYKKIMSAMR